MPTDFPGAADTFVNPTAGDDLDTPTVLHTDQHTDLNDAVEAIEAYLLEDTPTQQARVIVPDGRLVVGATNHPQIPGVYVNAQASSAITANRLQYADFYCFTPITISAFVWDLTSAGAAGTKFRLGIYERTADYGVGALLVATGEEDATVTGVTTRSFTPVTLPAGRYYQAYNSSGTPSFRVLNAQPVLEYHLRATNWSAGGAVQQIFKDVAFAALQNPGVQPDTVGYAGPPAGRRFIAGMVVSDPEP